MYADDTTIYFYLEDSFDSNNLEIEINAELHKVSISIWLKKYKLSLNSGKTSLMIFHRKQKRVKKINIIISSTNIECVQYFNFPGIILSKNMS